MPTCSEGTTARAHCLRPGAAALGAGLLALGALLPATALGDPVFLDRSDTLPVQHVYAGGWEHFVGGGVAIFDCNADLRPDMVVAGGDNPVRLFVNTSDPAGDIRFEMGDLAPVTGVTGAYPLDLDSDAITDLVILRNGPNIVLKGAGDCTFVDAGTTWGVTFGHSWTTAFSATWEPEQMLPTLAFGNYVDTSDPDGPFGTCDTNWLIRPEGTRYGAPIALDPGFCPLSMLFSDWRRSGTPMLRLSNDRQYYVRDGREQMWALDPLAELGPEQGWDTLQLWGMGIASRDLTGDGRPEVMLTSMGDQMLMENTGDGFTMVPYATGTFAQRPFVGDEGRPSTGWHPVFGDIDNDGHADLFITKGNVEQMPGMAMKDPNNLLMQQAGGTFVERADVAGIATTHRSRGAGLVDLNGDGLLDLVVVNRRAPLEVWQNATESAGNWLTVRLQQPAPNTHAIGAIVELRTPLGLQTQEITIGGGHAGGHLAPLHFGLGDHSAPELRVHWPDGTETPWTPMQANTAAVVKKPD